MAQNATKPWPVWRTQRLLALMEQKALGKNDEQAGKALAKPIHRSTVNRELNSPEAAAIGRKMRGRASTIFWALFQRQAKQIENDASLTAGQKLIYRQQLLSTMAGMTPRQVETKVSGEIDQRVKMLDVTEEDLISVVAPAVKELMEREARGLDGDSPEEDPEEPVD